MRSPIRTTVGLHSKAFTRIDASDVKPRISSASRIPSLHQGSERMLHETAVHRRIFSAPAARHLDHEVGVILGHVVEVVRNGSPDRLGWVVTEAVDQSEAGHRVLHQSGHSHAPRQPGPGAFRRQPSHRLVFVLRERLELGVGEIEVVPRNGRIANSQLARLVRCSMAGSDASGSSTPNTSTNVHSGHAAKPPIGGSARATATICRRARSIVAVEAGANAPGDRLDPGLQFEPRQLGHEIGDERGPIEPRRLSGEAIGDVLDNAPIDHVLEFGRHEPTVPGGGSAHRFDNRMGGSPKR